MKRRFPRLVWIALLGIAVTVAAMLHQRRRNEQQCVSHMKILYSAGVSFCLESRRKPDEVLTIEQIKGYVLPWGTTCPVNGTAYPSFTVLNGPVCPNGHLFAPGEPRPLRASAGDVKLSGLYEASGFTNLIRFPPVK
jgi:hypothetical protein